jgi:hypothetical protein
MNIPLNYENSVSSISKYLNFQFYNFIFYQRVLAYIQAEWRARYFVESLNNAQQT